MQRAWRKPRPLRDEPEFVFGLLVIPLCLLALFLITLVPGEALPSCHLYRATGVPCPTCGTYRAACLLAHGHLVRAWLRQPLMTAVILGAGLYSFYALVAIVGRRRRLHVRLTRREWSWMVVAAAGLLVLNWIYLLAV